MRRTPKLTSAGVFVGAPHRAAGPRIDDVTYKLLRASPEAVALCTRAIEWNEAANKDDLDHSPGCSHPRGRMSNKPRIGQRVRFTRHDFFNVGHYAEVSHRLEEVAFKAGAPIVCAMFARDVLNKSVEPARDGVHYRRAIKALEIFHVLPRIVIQASPKNIQPALPEYFSAREPRDREVARR